MNKNLHCPVDRCQTTKPHTDDPYVSELIAFSDTPQVYLNWVRKSLIVLRDSMIDDFKNIRHFGWLSRIRVVEELYFRTLYHLFVASPEEVPHLLSGEYPNSFSFIYERVNRELLLSRGDYKHRNVGLGEFSMLDLLNLAAHGSYPMLLAIERTRDKRDFWNINDYVEKNLNAHIERVEAMGILFVVDGADRETVKARIIDLHEKEFGKQGD